MSSEPTVPTPASTMATQILSGFGAAPAEGSAPAVASAVGSQVGEWTLVQRLGAGAMGEVFLATRPAQGGEGGVDEAALKLITNLRVADADFHKRFDREISVLAKLDHPNITRALGHGVDQGRPYLAMEFVRGPNLHDVLGERGSLPEADVLRYAIQIARGLAYVHTEIGLIHRDIKPANLLIARGPTPAEDTVKIIDFGLAKSIDGDDQRLTLTGMIMGTPNYMAPEQIRSEPNLTYHADMYALGVTLYHLLTGRLPYAGASPALVMTGHLTKSIPDPGEAVTLSQPTRTLVMKAMGKAVRERFADYRAFINACERALKALGDAEVAGVRLQRRPGTAIVRPLVRREAAEGALEARDAPPPTDGTGTVARHTAGGALTGSLAKAGANDATVVSAPIRRYPSEVIAPDPAPPADGSPTQALSRVPGAPEPRERESAGTSGSQALRTVVTTKLDKIATTSRTRRRREEAAAEGGADGDQAKAALHDPGTSIIPASRRRPPVGGSIWWHVIPVLIALALAGVLTYLFVLNG